MATATPLSALIAPWSSAAYTTTSSEPSGPRRCTDVPRAATTVMSRSSDDSTSETALRPRVASFHSAASVARSLASIASRAGTRLGSVLIAAPSSVPSSARIFTMRPLAESGRKARRNRALTELLRSPARQVTSCVPAVAVIRGVAYVTVSAPLSSAMPLAPGGGASPTDGALTRISTLQLARGAVLSVSLPYSDETACTGATVALAAAVGLALASGALAGWPAPAQAASRTAASAAVCALTSAEPHEVTEEEILALRERPHVLRPEVEDEESADPDVRDLRAVGRPCRDDVVAGLADGPHAGAVARSEEQLGGDVEVREPGSLHARHRVTGAREDELTAARLRRRRGGEARGLQGPPAVLRLEEGPRVRAVDVRGPEPVGLALVEVHVHDLRAVG